MENLQTHPGKEGNTIYCINNGFSRSKGEPYYKGKEYKISNWYTDDCDNLGIQGLHNIVDKVNFSLSKPEEIINNYSIY